MPSSIGTKLGRKTFSSAKKTIDNIIPGWFKGVIATATILLVLAAFVAAWKPVAGTIMPLVRSESDVYEGFDGACGGACTIPQ
jgi:hypothetical protein